MWSVINPMARLAARTTPCAAAAVASSVGLRCRLPSLVTPMCPSVQPSSPIYTSSQRPSQAQFAPATWSDNKPIEVRRPEALVINIFCRTRYGLLHEICRVLVRLGFNLRKSDAITSEGQMSIMLTVCKEGGLVLADAMRVENALKECQLQDEVFACKVLPSSPFPGARVAQVAEIIGLDRPGIVANVAARLDARNIEILNLETSVEDMGYSMPMFRSKMTLCLSEGAAAECQFETRDEERDELDRIVHEVELELDPDIQMAILCDSELL
eukprot:m.167601 g.167601  ORF g.167601 m.167601 type:complete len:270 (+) comp12847_c0_seq1:341-1150(+)